MEWVSYIFAMAISTAQRQKIRDCLTKSKRWGAYDAFRSWYKFKFLQGGKTLKEAKEAAWEWALKLYEDWDQTDPVKAEKCQYPRPSMNDIKVEAAKAGFIHGHVTESSLREYERLRQALGLEVNEPLNLKKTTPGKLEPPLPELDGGTDIDVFAEKPPCNALDETRWVMAHIDVTEVEQVDAPSAAAWTLLNWAKENQDDFIKNYYARSMPSRSQLDREYAKMDRGEVQLDFIERLRKTAEKLELDVV